MLMLGSDTLHTRRWQDLLTHSFTFFYNAAQTRPLSSLSYYVTSTDFKLRRLDISCVAVLSFFLVLYGEVLLRITFISL